MVGFSNTSHRSLLDQRIDSITGRCHYVLRNSGVTQAEILKHVRAMARWFQMEGNSVEAFSANRDFSAPYTRPISASMWDERFNLARSIVNQPVTKEHLKHIGTKKELPNHRLYGYIAALSLLQIMRDLMRLNIVDLKAYSGFGGPYEEGGEDYTAFELEEEYNIMIENLLGKAEEFIFKSDVLSEHAGLGQKSARPRDERWESLVEIEIKKLGSRLNNFRFKSGYKAGRINVSSLSDYLHTMVRTDDGCPSFFPGSPRTVARELPNILTRLQIPDI
jgi:hypothetical protein